LEGFLLHIDTATFLAGDYRDPASAWLWKTQESLEFPVEAFAD
jgi:hypothetical protein